MSYLIVFIPFALSIFLWLLHRRNRLRLPPGPKGWPILGNLSDSLHGEEHVWLRYADWASRYGDIIHLETFGQTTMILNSAEAAIELLDKRSFNYSDRPDMPMANDLMKWDWDFAHMRYSDKWRLHRKTFHQYFQPREMGSYYSMQMSSAATLLQGFLHSPEDFVHHVRSHAGRVILKAVYGYELKGHQDRYVTLVAEAMSGLIHAVHAGSFLVDFIPILKYVPSWFPGAKFKRQAQEWSKSALAMKNRPFDELKVSIANGTATPSFVTKNLERMQHTNAPPEMEEVIKNCAGVSYLGGSDTTVSVIESFILAMILYPDIQARAQAEIDAVVGGSRLPDFKDRPDMPYVEAILTETIRWIPVSPLVLPHRNIRGDEYKGYHIPPGSAIVANVWAMLHDPDTYSDPLAFKPERFLVQDPPPHPINYAFGFGRRICPGRYFALNSVWIAIVSLLSAFTIEKARDASGKEITPMVDCTDGAVVHPIPFDCTIKPRSSEAIHLIEDACDTSS